MFELTTEENQSQLTRHRINVDTTPMSFRAVLNGWESDESFRSICTEWLASSSFDGFRWETPALTTNTADDPFEFVLVNSPFFCKRKTDKITFAKKFREGKGKDVITFANLRGDANMIVPTPQTKNDVYGHFASFIRSAPKSQIDSLWQVIGETVRSMINDEPIWLSTAGGGVAWLHVRIDSTPKYYNYAPYRSIGGPPS